MLWKFRKGFDVKEKSKPPYHRRVSDVSFSVVNVRHDSLPLGSSSRGLPPWLLRGRGVLRAFSAAVLLQTKPRGVWDFGK